MLHHTPTAQTAPSANQAASKLVNESDGVILLWGCIKPTRGEAEAVTLACYNRAFITLLSHINKWMQYSCKFRHLDAQHLWRIKEEDSILINNVSIK